MTATILGNDLDEEVIDVVDLAPPPIRCDGVDESGNDCEEPAVFKTHTRCCGFLFYFCEDCWYITLRVLKNLPGSGRCKSCGNKISDLGSHLVFDGRI